MLPSRFILCALIQAFIAGVYALSGNRNPWQASAAWWIDSATLGNFISIGLLAWLAKGEGLRLVDTHRLLMLFPFALMAALILRWRPRLLPYMMVVHGLLDMSLVPTLFPAG